LFDLVRRFWGWNWPGSVIVVLTGEARTLVTVGWLRCDSCGRVGVVDTSRGPVRPIVVTLAVDGELQGRWDALRGRYFPAHRLLVGAHVTLFHAVPGVHEAAVLADVRAVASVTEPFPVAEGAPYSLGSGVALRVTSARLGEVHADLAGRWRAWLTRQDAQPFRPHVTVQNKVDPRVAGETLAVLSGSTGSGWTGTATGIALWHYDGGPWSPIETVSFASRRDTRGGA
jgi:hypothetical protein